MRPWTELGHRPKIAPLLGRQAIEPNPEKASIEALDDTRLRSFDIGRGDRRPRRLVPYLICPFLNEVGIPVS